MVEANEKVCKVSDIHRQVHDGVFHREQTLLAAFLIVSQDMVQLGIFRQQILQPPPDFAMDVLPKASIRIDGRFAQSSCIKLDFAEDVFLS